MSTGKDGPAVLVRMPRELIDEIKDRAVADERTMSQTIRFAIKHHLEGCGAGTS